MVGYLGCLVGSVSFPYSYKYKSMNVHRINQPTYSVISCAVPVVYPDGYLYVKDKDGGLKPWTPTGKWIDKSRSMVTNQLMLSVDDKYRDGSIDKQVKQYKN